MPISEDQAVVLGNHIAPLLIRPPEVGSPGWIPAPPPLARKEFRTNQHPYPQPGSAPGLDRRYRRLIRAERAQRVRRKG